MSFQGLSRCNYGIRDPNEEASSKTRLNSSSSEDDAYILLHPSGTIAGTLGYTGDSGFEDVQPLQRLDQEAENDPGESSEPESKYILLLCHIIISITEPWLDIVLYCQFSIFFLLTLASSIKGCVCMSGRRVGNGVGFKFFTPLSIILKC